MFVSALIVSIFKYVLGAAIAVGCACLGIALAKKSAKKKNDSEN